MNKIITSAGLVVLGTASLQAAYAPELSESDASKPWSVAATLRGFYDDNYTTRPKLVDDGTGHAIQGARSSFGFDLSPSANLKIAHDQTYIGLSYIYDMRYYDDRRNNSADQSHQVDFTLNHSFTERYKLDLGDSFVIAQEPQVLDPDLVTLPLRADGNNLRNTAHGSFTAQMTEELSLVLGYSNTIYDYEMTGPSSYSALLDRMEHLGSLNLRWQALPSTVAVLGYEYGVVDHTSKDSLGPVLFVNSPADPFYVNPNIRDERSHYAFVGVDQFFNPQLSASIRVGAQFTDYNNLHVGSTDTISPYVDASLTWNFAEGSAFQVGVRNQRSATDVVGTDAASPVLDAETTGVYGSISHHILPMLVGSLVGQFQHSDFRGGSANGQAEDFYTLGVNFNYQFNQYFSGDLGYNYDKLESDVGAGTLFARSYDRNRVYLGIRANY